MHEEDGMKNRTIFFDTYPHWEDEDYDNNLIVFEVPLDWAVDWIETEGEMDFREFLDEYTWDSTIAMYEKACADGVLISEHVEPRFWYGPRYGRKEVQNA